MDLFDWLLNNGSVLDGTVICRIAVLCIIIQLFGILCMIVRKF